MASKSIAATVGGGNNDRENTGGTQTIQRACLLLRLTAANNRLGMRLVDLYRSAGLERPTAHRLLQGLIAERLVRQDTVSKRYFLGTLMYEMGLAATPKTSLRDICHPHLQTIADRTCDTVFLTERSGFDGVCVDRAEGAFPIKVFVLEIGRRRPLNVGGGALAILSGLPDIEVGRICQANRVFMLERYPRYSEAALTERIAETRRSGYAIHEVMEVPDVKSIAVPIRDAQRRAIAAISISALASRVDADRIPILASHLFEAVAAIERQIANAQS